MADDLGRHEELGHENAALKKKLGALEQENALWQEKYARQDAEYRKVIAALKKSLVQSQSELERLRRDKEAADYYKRGYAALDEAYKKFQGLPEGLRYRLEGIFGNGSTPQGFLAGGVQIENLDKFYDLLFGELNAAEVSEAGRTLREIFDFCFDMVNAGGLEPVYERLADETGADYDSDTMMRTAKGSRQLGRVRETRLRGYCHWRTKVVQRRSLVVIG